VNLRLFTFQHLLLHILAAISLEHIPSLLAENIHINGFSAGYDVLSLGKNMVTNAVFKQMFYFGSEMFLKRLG